MSDTTSSTGFAQSKDNVDLSSSVRTDSTVPTTSSSMTGQLAFTGVDVATLLELALSLVLLGGGALLLSRRGRTA